MKSHSKITLSRTKKHKQIQGFLWDNCRFNRRSKGLLVRKYLQAGYRYGNLNQQRRNLKRSRFCNQLKSKRQLTYVYGNIPRKVLKNYKVNLKQKSGGFTSMNMLRLLEMRLDTCIFRMGIFSSFASARQSINHNYVLINHKPMNIVGYQVQFGDIISFKHSVNQWLSTQLKHKVARHSLFKINKTIRKYDVLNGLSWYNDKAFTGQQKQINFLTFNSRNLKRMNYQDAKAKLDKRTHLDPVSDLSFNSKNIFLSLKENHLIKPSNLEINYKYLTALALFPSQEVFLPMTFNIDEAVRFI